MPKGSPPRPEPHPACASIADLVGQRLIIDYEDHGKRGEIHGTLLHPPGPRSFYFGEPLRYGIFYAEHRNDGGGEERIHAIWAIDGRELYLRT